VSHMFVGDDMCDCMVVYKLYCNSWSDNFSRVDYISYMRFTSIVLLCDALFKTNVMGVACCIV